MNSAARKLLLPLLATKVKIQFPELLTKVTYVGSYLLLHYKFDSSNAFLKYEDYLTNHELFKKHLDNGNSVIYSFDMPREFIREINLFHKDRIEEFSDDAKNIILKEYKPKKDLDFLKLKYIWTTDENEKNKIRASFYVIPSDLDKIKIDLTEEKFNYLRDMDLSFDENIRKKLNFN